MIFVDTSGWISLLDEDDAHHESARAVQVELRRGVHGRIVTTDYVLDEAVTYLRKRGEGAALRAFRAAVRESRSIQVVWTSPATFWAAWDLLESHDDKPWSLTDCVSFVTMRSLGIGAAFGFDDDFRQAGFVLVPPRGA